MASEAKEKFEYPIWYLNESSSGSETRTTWTVYDLLTGKQISSTEGPLYVTETNPETGREKKVPQNIEFVLDSDHALTDEGLYWIPTGKKIQDLPELKKSLERGWQPTKIFVALPPQEEYAYTDIYNVIDTFDPDFKVQKLVTFALYSRKITVWGWNPQGFQRGSTADWAGNKLVKDHEFTFKGQIGKFYPLPSKVAGPNKILFRFIRSFVIYDVVERRRVRAVRVRADWEWFPFLYPDGRLGVLTTGQNGTYFVDMSAFLKTGKSDFGLPGNLNYVLASYPVYCRVRIILNDPEHPGHFIIFVTTVESGRWILRTFDRSKVELKISDDERIVNAVLHGTDICVFRNGSMRVFNPFKKRQSFLTIPEARESSHTPHLRGNLYLVDTNGSLQLLEYYPKTDKYKTLRKIQIKRFHLLPVSQRQKRQLAERLDKVIAEGGGRVPKEISRVIAGFI